MLGRFMKSKSMASQALDAFGKTKAAIEQNVTGLQPMIERRLTAERGLAEARGAAALGEPADVKGAEKELGAALAELESASTLLNALRLRLASSAPDLKAAYEGAQKALPEHGERLRADFAREWEAGVAAFAFLLGRRMAVEAHLGPMRLSSPAPETVKLGEEARPFVEVDELRAAIKHTVAEAGHEIGSVEILATGAPVRPYDPRAVYRLTHRATGLPAGTLVVESSFAPGRLRNLVASEWATPVADEEARLLARRARRVAREVDADRLAEENALRAAEERRMKEENFAEAERRNPALRWREETKEPDPPKITEDPGKAEIERLVENG